MLLSHKEYDLVEGESRKMNSGIDGIPAGRLAIYLLAMSIKYFMITFYLWWFRYQYKNINKEQS